MAALNPRFCCICFVVHSMVSSKGILHRCAVEGIKIEAVAVAKYLDRLLAFCVNFQFYMQSMYGGGHRHNLDIIKIEIYS